MVHGKIWQWLHSLDFNSVAMVKVLREFFEIYLCFRKLCRFENVLLK